MRKPIRLGVGLSLWLAAAPMSRADSTWEFSVQLSATVQTAPAQIRLTWPQDSWETPSSYTLYRKTAQATDWGQGATLPGTTTAYVDQHVAVGTAYEYQIIKTTRHYTGYGYIYSGIQVPLIENRGKLLLVVDNTYASPLTAELSRLQLDLAGDGWTICRLDVNRADSVFKVKNLIKAQYEADPLNVKTVFLFGHVPVPYSGDIVPDGHVPDHQGAWPCDGFYGDMDGVWTDIAVNDTGASDPRTRNVPGDGKFDQSTFPAPLKLMVGRVDLADMPGRLSFGGPATFPSELELLRNYLNKDHQFRHKQFDLPRRAILGDYFGLRDGEAFAASGWRNLAPFFGPNKLTNLPEMGSWIADLSTNPCLCAYGCGAGSFTSISGLGNTGAYHDGLTTQMVSNDVKAAFILLFGSWLGDWDSEDNMLRSVLALPSYGLASAWSGRPHWFLHHMALGETIGFGARLTQNNGPNGMYQSQVNSAAGEIHIALMGDPTLRLHTVGPPTDVQGATNGLTLDLHWTGSSDTVLGYHVYSAATANGPFTRLTDAPIPTTDYAVEAPFAPVYMVRAVKLETSASGTYYNLSQGVFFTPAATGIDYRVFASNLPVTPGVAAGKVTAPLFKPKMVVPATVTPVSSTNAAVSPGLNTERNQVAQAPIRESARRLTPTGFILTNNIHWVDDALPSGAVGGADGGDGWNWVSSNPSPLIGKLAHQSNSGAGLHEHYFAWASGTGTLSVNTGEVLYAYVYLDPTSAPTELMLQWYDGSWEHRAYWGGNTIPYGMDGSASRRYVGALPAPGQWALLQVPASQVGLEGSTLSGMSFSLQDGRATWDNAGKATVVADSGGGSGSGTTSTNSTNSITLSNAVVWVEDALPAGATGGADGGDSWNWTSNNPAPFSGKLAQQSSLDAGLHEHYFAWATSTLTVNHGDSLFAYVYLDPATRPSELMLQWYDGSWEHRAYWGANDIANGTDGSASRRYAGALPAAGQWTLLSVPASQVGLEGSTLSGMAFSLFDGRATWDHAGKAAAVLTVTSAPPTSGGGTTNTTTNPPPVVATTNPPSVTATNTGPVSNLVALLTNMPGLAPVDYAELELPPVGSNALHVLSPTLLELRLINTKQPDPTRVAQWDFVDANNNFSPPASSAFAVTANGQSVAVINVGFKRRPIYAPLAGYDLRIENSLYLQLAQPISDNQSLVVKNPDGTLWPASLPFAAKVDPLRFSPAIHVNQEGYLPNYTKKAMVGYYAGSLGELNVIASSGFKIVDATTGTPVYQGTLNLRTDTGWTYSPSPYQRVYEADFTALTTPGEYRLVVPGFGASLPFQVSEGIAMAFARSYALGLYHQRCGTNTALPYTRFTHDVCHAAPVTVPASAAAYPFTWTTIAGYANTLNANNPPQIAPALTSPAAQLFPYVNPGPLNVSGGHHDAGDYSKYTINSASFIHYLIFAVDSLAGVASLDNLGIPESGDGISDVLQEAKWEADFLAKMQDADGGFYFLVYPVNREYEGNVTPDHGDPQVVWPKTTSVTAAAVAALAQCASSPAFKQAYPATAAQYLQKATLGWQFLTNAIAKYGKNGAYQKITHYGDDFADNDELVWAACQIFLATGNTTAHQDLLAWFDPANPATWRWGWWRMSQCYGHAIRSYAFAVQSGRVASASKLDATFLAKCQTQITAAGDDVVSWSQQSAYGTSFPPETKAVNGAGWYFSTDQAFDAVVAYQLNPKASYLSALLANMNYEGGGNPVNVTYVTGLGWKRERDIVSQWALNDKRALPPSGIPAGNIQSGFSYLWNYQGELTGLSFPSDNAVTAPYPFYDRWGDSWNVTTEFVILNSARSLAGLAFLAAQTSLKTQAWKAIPGRISAPAAVVPVGAPVTLTLAATGLDLSTARVVWEGSDQEPAFGSTFSFTPKNNGSQWVEAEAQLPDGRRIFAATNFVANSPNIIWVDDAVPAGATTGADGGDAWNWVSSTPTPFSGSLANQSAVAAGAHQHYFSGASVTMSIGTGDVLYAYIYLDPANPPSEVMLQWNNGSWEHRAYWGANNLNYGTDGTPSRRYMGPRPATGQWVQLKVPASQVGLEGSILNGMAFTLYNGRATWDTAGRLSQGSAGQTAQLSVTATVATASRLTATPALFTISRTGDTTSALTINYSLGGTAIIGADYQASPAGSTLTIPATATSATVTITPLPSTNLVSSRTINFALAPNSTYALGSTNAATASLSGNSMPNVSAIHSTNGTTVSWNSNPGRLYQVLYKNNVTDAQWTIAKSGILASYTLSSWLDASTNAQRYYAVAQTN